MTTTAEDKFVKLKERLDNVVESGVRDDILAVLDLINKEKEDMTLALLKKTRLGVPVGKLTKHSDSDISSQAKNIILVWKKLTSTATATKKSAEASGETKSASSGTDSKSSSAMKRPAADAAEAPAKRKKEEPAETAEMSKEDKMRFRMRGLLEKALAREKESKDESFLYTAEEAATCIEQAVFEKHNKVANDDYGRHMRMLFLNFDSSGRSDLRQRVLTEADIRKWASVSSEYLMSDKQRSEMLRSEEEHSRNIKSVDPLENVPEGINKCSRGGSRRVHTYQLQTRGADEPMTIFYTCAECKKKWRT